MKRMMGRDVSVDVIRGGALQDTLKDVKSFEWTTEIELKKEHFLGERSPRHDEAFDGCKGTLDLQLHSRGALDLIQDVKLRAQRGIPGFAVNVCATFDFPGGDGPVRVLFPDIKFSSIPVGTSGQQEYVTQRLEWASDDFQIL